MSIDYRALASFRYELRKFLAFSEAAARQAGLTPQQYQTLLTIKGLSPDARLSIREIADFMLIKHHTAVELVDRMARRGWVERQADPRDRRRALVALTVAGEDGLRRLAAIHARELGTIGPVLAALLHTFGQRDGAVPQAAFPGALDGGV